MPPPPNSNDGAGGDMVHLSVSLSLSDDLDPVIPDNW